MSRRTLHLVLLAILLAIAPSLATAGKISIANNGAPLGGAMVSVETFGGEQLATAQTNPGGVADCVIPQTGAGQPLVFKVTDKAGNVSEHLLAQPADKPWHLVAMDTQGGIVGYSKETYDHLKAAMEPIHVGKNSEVGSGARLKGQIKKSVGGGAFGGGKSTFSLGGGGGGGMSGMRLAGPKPKGDRDIEIHDDPIADADKRIFTDPATGTKIAVGTQFMSDGLLASNDILNAPGDGTFQSVSLMDENGNMAGPTRYMIHQTYVDWWLSVVWWRKTYVDGQLVSHEEGGWSDEGRILGDKYRRPIGSGGVWNQLGFEPALGGVERLGAVFPQRKVDWDNFKQPLDLSNLMHAQPTMTLIGHITLPDKDPVTTTGFAFGLASPTYESMLRRAALRNEITNVRVKIRQKEDQLAGLRRIRAIDEASRIGNVYTDPASGIKFEMDDEQWARRMKNHDDFVKKVETELKDLQDAEERLRAEQEGRFEPVIDHLQPIVILA